MKYKKREFLSIKKHVPGSNAFDTGCRFTEEIKSSTNCMGLKVNLHLLDACNYRCRHCFAHFKTRQFLPVSNWIRIVDSCLDSGLVNAFNLAGGEPLMYPELSKLIDHIHGRHAKCSVISNGSLLDLEWCHINGSKLDVLGVSIDTLNAERARKLGRADRNGTVLDMDNLSDMFQVLKDQQCQIKVNTVVSDVNCTEQMGDAVHDLGVSRWKIIKMKPYHTATASNSGIGQNEDAYEDFLRRNGLESLIGPLKESPDLSVIDRSHYPGMEVVAEPDLENSYLVVSPNGDLCRNDTFSGETQSVGNIRSESFRSCLERLPLQADVYSSRYSNRSDSLPSLGHVLALSMAY